MNTAASLAEPLRAAAARAYARGDLVLAAGALGLCVARALDPAHIEHGPVLCPFRRLTGLPCPGCGMTRSWVYLTHGDWSRALHANAFGVVFAVLVVAGVLWRVGAPALGGRTLAPLAGLVASRRALLALWAPWLAFGAVRAGLALAT